MNDLLIGLVGALLATNQPQAVSNLIQQSAGLSINIPNPNDPAEKELDELMTEDDAAMAEMDKWIRDNDAFTAQGAGNRRRNSTGASWPGWMSSARNTRIFCGVIPDSARGHLAYASFLNNIGDEEAAKVKTKRPGNSTPKIRRPGTTSPTISAKTARSPTPLRTLPKPSSWTLPSRFIIKISP